MSALDRKLFRELSRLKGQILTIALVLASGITCFLSMRGTYDSLEGAREAYYDRYRFAHVFARVERAPEPVGRRIETLPGVAIAQTRIVKDISLPLEGLDRPAYGQRAALWLAAISALFPHPTSATGARKVCHFNGKCSTLLTVLSRFLEGTHRSKAEQTRKVRLQEANRAPRATTSPSRPVYDFGERS